MDDNKAFGIVSTLANGVNPLTGEVFPTDSPYQSPEIVRALFIAARALKPGGNAPGGQAKAIDPNAAPRPVRPRAEAPTNVGKPWSKEEDDRLLSEFDRGRSPRELATAHGRTLAGVEARLEKHGRLQAQQRVTSNRFQPQDARRSPQSQPPETAGTGRNQRA